MRVVEAGMTIAVIGALIIGIAIGAAFHCPISETDMDQRYQQCLQAGGSFSKNDVDWTCTQP